jgi:O-antigen ligase
MKDTASFNLTEKYFSLPVIIFTLFEVLITAFVCRFYSDKVMFLPLILIAGTFFLYSFVNLGFWLFTAILCFFPILVFRGSNLSASQYLYALYLYVPLIWWFFKKIFILKERIFDDFTDWAVLVFVLMCFFSIIITKYYGFDTGMWLREFLVYVFYLYYYPIKDFLKKKKKNLNIIIAALLSLTIIITLYYLYSYTNKMALAQQFFQVYGNRMASNEDLFMISILIVYPLIFTTTSRKTRLFFIGIFGMFIVGLLVTFTRSYLFLTILGLLIIPFFMEKNHRKRMYLLLIELAIVALLILFLLFNKYAKILFEGIIYRYLGTGKGDMSLMQRIIESQALYKVVEENPFLGYGLGATFRRYDLWFELHRLVYYAHNAYLYLWFKLGIPGLVCFMSVYLYKVYECWFAIKKCKDIIRRNLLVSFLVTLVLFLGVSWVAPEFYYKAGVLIIAIGWAIITVTTEENKNNKTANETAEI